MCEKVPSILHGEKICDSCRKQLAAESERHSLPEERSESFPESDVVFPTDEMFGHPLATLAVANGHLDAIRGNTSHQTKAAMMQKAVLDGTWIFSLLSVVEYFSFKWEFLFQIGQLSHYRQISPAHHLRLPSA